MHLDDLRHKPDVEPLSATDCGVATAGERSQMLDAIRDDPSMGEDIMDSADYLRVELHVAAQAPR